MERMLVLLVRRWGMKRVLLHFLLLALVLGLLILVIAVGGNGDTEPLPTDVTERPSTTLPSIPARAPSSETPEDRVDCDSERRAAKRTIENAYDRARRELDEALEDLVRSGAMATMSDAELDMVALAHNEATANAVAIRNSALARLAPCP